MVISHNLGDVFQVADRIVVLLLGRRVANELDETTPEEVVAAITGASEAYGRARSVAGLMEAATDTAGASRRRDGFAFRPAGAGRAGRAPGLLGSSP